MSRTRENPDKLFEVFLEVGRTADVNDEPFILQKYPLNYDEEDVLKSVPKFAFPCDTERTTVDHFTFTLTDLDSKFKFGFCRHATGAQTCFCIVSFLPWFEVFYNFLNILAEITNRSEDNDATNMLRAAFVHEVPSPGLPVTIVAGQEMFSFKAPEANKLPSIPLSRNLTEYYNAIDIENMMIVFASMLHERRIVVTSKKLSRLTAVVHGAASLLYPMYWQHLFIPVLPAFLIDYLTAPMPFVIGVHTTLMEKVQIAELGDAVIIDADNNDVNTDYDDVHNLPDEMYSYLKRHLKGDKVKNSMQGSGDIISKTFMMSLVKLIGGYRDALMFHGGEEITFNPQAFVQSRPVSMQPFLENMLHLQIFQQFINDRLDMLNCGRGFTDVFEQECLIHADKLNAQTRYNEWLGKMKKQGKKLHRGGKDVWSDFKVKAGPVMKEAKGMMDIMTHRMKTQGKKVYSRARTKINDLQKDDASPKPSKVVRAGVKTKSFSKEKPAIILKDRPSTIVGTPLKTMRPPRPGMSPGTDTPDRAKPQFVIRQPSTDRPHRHVSHIDEKRVSSDDSDLVYTRMSMNLMADPDIQNAMFKSASAENLPKTDPKLQSSDSSGTITSTSSFENEADRGSFLYMEDGGDASRHKGDNSAITYTNLMNDDDSGIVMRTDSQSSLDRNRFESGAKYEKSTMSQSINVTLDSKPPPRPAPVSSDTGLPPPRPAPRKSVSPNVAVVEDHVIRSSGLSRERPKPAPRKQSFDRNLPKPCGDSLIDFGGKTAGQNVLDLSADIDTLNMGPAGDYVLLREPLASKVDDSSFNRRSSVTRTPAMKLGQNETPKRPSVRREPSPISPEKSPQTGSVLDFDPLYYSSSTPSSQQTVTQTNVKVDQSDNDDSLLKDWNIGGLTGFSKTTKQNLHQSGVGYSHPTPPPRQPINPNAPKFYTPQPYMSNTQSAVGFQYSSSNTNTPPSVPPRPKKYPNTERGQGVKSSLFKAQSASETRNQSDPFSDLVSLDQPSSQQSPSQNASWETFN